MTAGFVISLGLFFDFLKLFELTFRMLLLFYDEFDFIFLDDDITSGILTFERYADLSPGSLGISGMILP